MLGSGSWLIGDENEEMGMGEHGGPTGTAPKRRGPAQNGVRLGRLKARGARRADTAPAAPGGRVHGGAPADVPGASPDNSHTFE